VDPARRGRKQSARLRQVDLLPLRAFDARYIKSSGFTRKLPPRARKIEPRTEASKPSASVVRWHLESASYDYHIDTPIRLQTGD
jgi:hypothetical protein